jgi:hypothetical protein
MTSLEVIISEIQEQHVKLDNQLEILWTITHFPPALLSFMELYENTDLDNLNMRSDFVYSVRILAESFREIFQKIVPPWISKSPDMLLESSRQIFARWHTLSTQAELSDGGITKMGHSNCILSLVTSSSEKTHIAQLHQPHPTL